jgi:hypothetical protein
LSVIVGDEIVGTWQGAGCETVTCQNLPATGVVNKTTDCRVRMLSLSLHTNKAMRAKLPGFGSRACPFMGWLLGDKRSI